MAKTIITIQKQDPNALPITKNISDGYLVAYIEDGHLKVLEADIDMKALAPMLLKFAAERVMHGKDN